MTLNRQNKIRQYHATSAADTIKGTLDSHHVDADWLADKMNLPHEKMRKVLNRKDCLTMEQFKQVQSLIGLPAQLLQNLDINYYQDHLYPAEQFKIEEREKGLTNADFENIDDLDWNKL